MKVRGMASLATLAARGLLRASHPRSVSGATRCRVVGCADACARQFVRRGSVACEKKKTCSSVGFRLGLQNKPSTEQETPPWRTHEPEGGGGAHSLSFWFIYTEEVRRGRQIRAAIRRSRRDAHPIDRSPETGTCHADG